MEGVGILAAEEDHIRRRVEQRYDAQRVGGEYSAGINLFLLKTEQPTTGT